MPTNLLERDSFLLTLAELFDRASAGLGRTVLITGEAGIGKTSLVERFLDERQAALRVMWGACEALFTPRPLGPLYDITQQTQSALRALLDGDVSRATLFAAVLDELAHGLLPTVLVIEDIHWADEATLDLIKFLARRIHYTATLLVLTYRDDEIGPYHPLRLVLGDLPARDVTRLRLPLLSEAAVVALAKEAGHSVENLYAATGGNPFFVTEVLASTAPGTPTSVRDAVLAQVARLSHEAQSLLELLAAAAAKISWGVVEAVGGSAADSARLDECLVAGMVQMDGGAVGFRHELARQAVESALSPARKRALHAQLLHALLDRSAEQAPLAQLVHHAAQADDRASVLRFAPDAARQASAQGAHREAAAHYATALRYADHLEPECQANLLEALSYEHYLTGMIEDAVEPRKAALAIWRRLGRPEKVGHTLRQMSRLSWFLVDLAAAERYGVEAVELLEILPPSQELALAYGNLSHLYMLESDIVNAVRWGQRAIELAERLHDAESECYALNNVGCAEMADGNHAGWFKLTRSLQLALEHDFEEHVARAYANLATLEVAHRNYISAKDFIQRGLAYASEHDLGSWEHCLRGQQARASFNQGAWAAADEDATAILNVSWASGSNRCPALIVLGHVRVRRGDPGAEAVLDEARDLALLTGELDYVAPVAVMRAEWRWLQGDRERSLAEAEVGLEKALHYHDAWRLGETAFWVWRAGGQLTPSQGIPEPFALQMAGDWCAAADAWERIGCPYEQALALMDGDEPALRRALEIFEQLEARPAAEMLRRRLRVAGARGLPRGPRRATRDHPYGLTNRQFEILLLLAEGLHNTEIAGRLSTTPKTAAHHVSDVLAKLNVRSRAEAVRVAHQVGIIPHAETLRKGANLGRSPT